MMNIHIVQMRQIIECRANNWSTVALCMYACLIFFFCKSFHEDSGFRITLCLIVSVADSELLGFQVNFLEIWGEMGTSFFLVLGKEYPKKW